LNLPKITPIKGVLWVLGLAFIAFQQAVLLTFEARLVFGLIWFLGVFFFDWIGAEPDSRVYKQGWVWIEEIGTELSKKCFLYNIEKNPSNQNRILTKVMAWQTILLEHNADSKAQVSSNYVPEHWDNDYLDFWEFQQLATRDANRNMMDCTCNKIVNLEVISVLVPKDRLSIKEVLESAKNISNANATV
jgi:hypothetical protein